jgi:hypothetical protein
MRSPAARVTRVGRPVRSRVAVTWMIGLVLSGFPAHGGEPPLHRDADHCGNRVRVLATNSCPKPATCSASGGNDFVRVSRPPALEKNSQPVSTHREPASSPPDSSTASFGPSSFGTRHSFFVLWRPDSVSCSIPIVRGRSEAFCVCLGVCPEGPISL